MDLVTLTIAVILGGVGTMTWSLLRAAALADRMQRNEETES